MNDGATGMPTSNVDLSRVVWRKSTCSTAEGQNCVEIADIDTNVAVRDSKNPAGPVLLFTRTQWGAFALTLKAIPPR
jgi:hypothetical protein